MSGGSRTGAVHALLVGINAYPGGRCPPLEGCLNDVETAEEALLRRTGRRLELRRLLDGDATVTAVESAVRDHLGRAGPGDTALFWFSGHGTEKPATERVHLDVEATGRWQALVCVDGLLVDKRLGALLDEVAARGVHTVAVLDCCYAGGATRGRHLTPRFASPDPAWFAAAARDARVPARPARHVLLAATRLDQPSYEGRFGGRAHGLFTYALLGALRAAGPEATYRELLAATRSRLQVSCAYQHPTLAPSEPGGAADHPFLDGAGARDPSPFLLREDRRDGWQVDCGAGHGLPFEPGTEFRVTSPNAAPGRPAERTKAAGRVTTPEPTGHVVRAVAVGSERTLVTPAGWEPEPSRVYPVALSALAVPPASVALSAPGDRAAARALRRALAEAGPGRGPSPLLRLVERPQEQAGDLLFRVEAREGRAHVLRRDGSPFVHPLPLARPEDADRVAACLVHLTRWHQLRDLEAPPGPVTGHVRLEITPWGGDTPLAADEHGEIVCRYDLGPGGPVPPQVSVRLRHTAPEGRRLWCLLLDLTDSFASHTSLFDDGRFVGPGRTGYALDNRPVQLSLPPHRPPRPGAFALDWLKLIVCEGELNTVPFHLDRWNPRAPLSSRDSVLRHADGALRLDPPERSARDAGPAQTGGPGQWATQTVRVRTVVPGW
ncbi:caspase family protein [Streptomyces sp. NPDC101166]|uniref:caspase family protein n=1 Tax=Streptomyces sp. NPDC101166 TaxID=3366120 RepID=UPI0038263043